MFKWLSKLMLKTPYQACSSCGNANRDQIENLRQKLINGDTDDVTVIPAVGGCCSGGSCESNSCGDECDCDGTCGDDCKCKEKSSDEPTYSMSFKL